VQDLEEDNRDRLIEVEMLADGRQAQQFLRLTEVGLDDDDLLRLGEQGVSVGNHDRIVVDIDDLRVRVDLVSDLMHVVLGRQAGPDVQELTDALLREKTNGPPQERPVFAHLLLGFWEYPKDALGSAAVSLEVLSTSQHVVIHPRNVRYGSVQRRVIHVTKVTWSAPGRVRYSRCSFTTGNTSAVLTDLALTHRRYLQLSRVGPSRCRS
jgi:hypothetical protein